MIECIFTIDYEIYGNGEGSLRELVYEPAEKLMAVFRKWDARFVSFIEVAEFEQIEAQGSDPDIDLVKRQIKNLHKDGFELGLHMHPQWYNARYEQGKWHLDYSEYNLCTLPQKKIVQFIERGISYLRATVEDADFAPFSFRAGNWLFQPTRDVAAVLADQGIKVDSSVFKGGLQHKYSLDYRQSLANGYYWKFLDDVNTPHPDGILLELPIYTKMVPFWKMLTTKRIGAQQQGYSTSKTRKKSFSRIRDFIRLRYPLKFDFCRMTIEELQGIVNRVIKESHKNSANYMPLVAIGHTKDLLDHETVDAFLSFLRERKVNICTFRDAYSRCK